MDIEKIEKLIELMKANDLAEVSLRSGEEEINLRRGPGGAISMPAANPGPVPQLPPVAPATTDAAPAAGGPAPDDDAKLVRIVSPMVGTFYVSPEPDAPAFVQVGVEVHPETIVCILEAMKVFNEIKAEVSGTIEKVLVKNEQAVEFGQPLFLVRPA